MQVVEHPLHATQLVLVLDRSGDGPCPESEDEGVLALVFPQPQRVAHGLQHVGGGAAAPPLLETGVPLDADVRAGGDLRASEARRAAPATVDGGLEVLPSGAQKGSEGVGSGIGPRTLAPVRLAVSTISAADASSARWS